MSKTSSKNVRAFYLPPEIDAAITEAADLDHGGNRSEYVKSVIDQDYRNRRSRMLSKFSVRLQGRAAR